MKMIALDYDWGYMTMTLYGGEVIEINYLMFCKAYAAINDYFKVGIEKEWVEI